jgi:hypothetical protein
MVKERFDQLIRELELATDQGKIRWQPTAKEGVFRVGLGEGMVRIHSESDQLAPYIAIYLIDRQGRIIDEYLVYKGEDMTFKMMENLYINARGSALNADKIIDSMLDDLKAGRTRELPPETERIPF